MRKTICIFLSALLLTACAQSMERQLDEVRAGYFSTDYKGAAQNFSGKKEADFDSLDNLELLITADSLFHENKFEESDTAYEVFNKRNLDPTSGDVGREVITLVAGNMANDYKPYMMDALFVSYYQLWDALALGNTDIAKVVINQSYALQQGMSQEYEDLIAETQESMAQNPDVALQLNNENSQWAAFRDIMNPALTYLAGIYFLNMGDFNEAKTYLKRANGMMPENDYVKDDLKSAEAKKIPSDTIWVFIEDSFSPKLYENRTDFPIATGNGISIMSVAVSEPLFFDSVVSVDDAQLIADVDAMFMTEYSQYRINEALRAFAAAASRLVLQTTLYNANNSYSPLMGMFATMYSVASTNAEVRTWATLPKTISVLRLKRDKSGLLEIKSGGNVIMNVPVPDSGNYLVYIRTGGMAYDAKPIRIK